MSEITSKITKPQMRRLLYSQIQKNLALAGVSVVIAGLAMKFGFGDKSKKAYADFYRTYNANEEFEKMRKKGLFDSCDAED